MTFLYAALIFFIAWRMKKKNPMKNKGKKVWDAIQFALMVIGVILLVAAPFTLFGYSSLGVTVGQLALWVLGLPAALFNTSAAMIATLLLAVAVFTAGLDFAADRVFNKPARISLIAIPFLAVISVGPIATGAQEINIAIRSGAAASVSWVWSG